ncbi:helix-turn-helix domain-containing protein [Alkalibacterium sp. f15]|uniref:helix-turn-helix domain-containing protein n=1 Tax=Alkalibacterium sp. f15 TaxID=3414029 RepID=UPI003BF7DC9A
MLGEKLRKLRTEKSISQIELASELFVTRQTISRWERGETIPSTDNIVQLSNFFDVETAFFLETFKSIENASNKKTNVFYRTKNFLSIYKLDIYIFSLLISPFFYILITPLSYLGLFYSYKYKKKYTPVVIILVITLTIYFSLDMIYILRLLFGSGTSTTEIFID